LQKVCPPKNKLFAKNSIKRGGDSNAKMAVYDLRVYL
jgi:hypothetical protein